MLLITKERLSQLTLSYCSLFTLNKRGGGGPYSQETQMKIIKALFLMSISDVVDYKGETKSADTELLFIVYAQ